MEHTIAFGIRLEQDKWVPRTKMKLVGWKIGIGDINQKENY